jgi:hypothetical protein
LLAAYYDRSLIQAERDRLEDHLADCARCQSQLAAIARADQRADQARPAIGIAWLRRWQVAVPALAAVAAVVVLVAVMRPAKDESRRDLQIAMAKREAPLMDLAERAPAPASAPAAANAPAAPASNELAMNKTMRAEQSGEHSEQMVRGGALLKEQKAKSLNANVYGRAQGGTSGAIASSVSAPETLVMISPPERRISAPIANSESGAAGSSVAGAKSAVSGAAVPAYAPSTLQQAAPTWMAGKRGVILFRSTDGSTHPQHSGVAADLTAGAAPSATVCWIVGRSGTIVRTIDGVNWAKVVPPTDADLVAVAADSAEHAIVTTVAGKNFETSDGGTSWRQQ